MTKNVKKALIGLVIVALAAVGAFIYSRSGQPDYSKVPNPTVTITMETGEEIHLELYPAIAPNTVANFVQLVQDGFYDGLIFHRVIPGFMIQGGDPNGNGTGGPGFTIKGEFSQNGFPNSLSHRRGVLSMARSADPNSAGSQFFIVQADSPHLDGNYAAFGAVTDAESLTVVDTIAATVRDSNDKPLSEWRIRSITVDTHGYEYKAIRTEK